MTRYLADIGPWRVPKSGHVTITKIENLHIAKRRKIHWFQKCYFWSKTKNNEVITENRFRTVASPSACKRLAVLNWCSSSIHPSSYCYYYLFCLALLFLAFILLHCTVLYCMLPVSAWMVYITSIIIIIIIGLCVECCLIWWHSNHILVMLEVNVLWQLMQWVLAVEIWRLL